jgi:hypothetical protein
LPFKIYPTLEPLRLPAEVRQSGIAALSAIAESVPAEANSMPDLQGVAEFLYLSAGITRTRNYPGGEIYFRAAACTGALYEVELYLVCSDLAGLEAGVYHFAPAEFGLRRLRRLSGRLGRYRHFGWDNGTLLANLLAVATVLRLPARVVSGFVDATVNGLLDVDSQREVAFSLVALGHASALRHSSRQACLPPA